MRAAVSYPDECSEWHGSLLLLKIKRLLIEKNDKIE